MCSAAQRGCNLKRADTFLIKPTPIEMTDHMTCSMIRAALPAAAFLAIASTLPCAAADTPADKPAAAAAYPTEYWTNDKDGWSVKTAACGTALCAYLVDFKPKPDEPAGYQPVDRQNPDKNRRQDKLCGHQMMGGFQPSNDKGATWDGGETVSH